MKIYCAPRMDLCGNRLVYLMYAVDLLFLRISFVQYIVVKMFYVAKIAHVHVGRLFSRLQKLYSWSKGLNSVSIVVPNNLRGLNLQ